MSVTTKLPAYDRSQTYAWNYGHPPNVVECDVPAWPGDWKFCGRKVGSPLGIAAGPLLNGRWILYYASLGFDVLTYKTVRSVERACYDLPNLQPVRIDRRGDSDESSQLRGDETSLPAAERMTGSWAVSFGMPSQPPDVWRADIEWTRGNLPREKVLIVSVVGTVQPDWTIDDMAADYARCARWAVESGADGVETNFSCPNVSTCDGQLFQQPQSAANVAARVREACGGRPYLIKIGQVNTPEEAAALIDAVAPYADGLSMTNSLATTVTGADGKLLFGGQRRGICGAAIREASIRQTRLFADEIARRGLPLRVVGVGGASNAEHIRQYLDAGAQAVHLATAVMVDPGVGIKIRQEAQ